MRTSDDITRGAYLWNAASGLLMAFQSVIMLAVVTRACGLDAAGILTMAYAHANLYVTVGKFGMRNYQASDVRIQHSFRAYAESRVASCTAMAVAGGVHLAVHAQRGGYAPDKAAVIACMLLFKLVDAAEDVVQGNYQQHGRLDIAGRILSVRLSSTIILFAASVAIGGRLLHSLVVATVYTVVFFVAETIWAHARYALPVSDQRGSRDAARLLVRCLPVFLATFLLSYIGNVPKYAIDAQLNDGDQAIYGFIAMPVFVVGLLASFIFNPIVTSLAHDWERGDVTTFRRRIAVQAAIVGTITALCVVGAILVGIPALELIYATSLSAHMGSLCILLVGGGFLALVTLLTSAITIMRQQASLTLGYVATAFLATQVAPSAVNTAGIAGAAWSYLGLMAFLALWFALVFARIIHGQ